MNKKKIIRNILSTLLIQVVTIIKGLILPTVLISSFGSEANGMVTSISRFLHYITLLEGGLGGVVMASLYKPLRENDQQKISAIFNATQRFFRQIALIYVGYVVVVAFVYPLMVETTFDYLYVVALVFVLALGLFIQYFFSISYQLLVKANQTGYLGSFVGAGTILLNIILIVVLTRIWPDLLFVKLVSASILVITPIVYQVYVKKNFQLDRKVAPDKEALKQRWSGFGHTLAYFANTNISVLALTVFSSLSTISVYSIYLMITNSLRNFSVAISTALMPSMGDVLAGGDLERSRKAFNVYEFGMSFFTTLLFVCGIVLMMPFVKIYTATFTDADYFQPAFGILLMIAEMVYCLREPYTNTAFAAGHFKPTAKFAYWEVGIHGVLALILVPKFGLTGVAIAFLVGLVYRMIAQIIYLKHHILKRPIRLFVKNILVFGLTGAGVVFLTSWLLPLDTITGYLSWVMYGAIVFTIALVALVLVSLIAYKEEMMTLVNTKLRKKQPQTTTSEEKEQ